MRHFLESLSQERPSFATVAPPRRQELLNSELRRRFPEWRAFCKRGAKSAREATRSLAPSSASTVGNVQRHSSTSKGDVLQQLSSMQSVRLSPMPLHRVINHLHRSTLRAGGCKVGSWLFLQHYLRINKLRWLLNRLQCNPATRHVGGMGLRHISGPYGSSDI